MATLKVGFVGCGAMGEPMAGHVLKSDKFDVHVFDINPAATKKIAKKGVAVKDIEAFCKGMQKLTKANFKTQKGELAKLLSNICPVLDQNKLSDYEKKIAAKTGIDYSVLDSALQDPPDDNS